MFEGRICLTYMYTSDIVCLRLFALWKIQLLHLHSNELLRASGVLYHAELYCRCLLSEICIHGGKFGMYLTSHRSKLLMNVNSVE